MRITVNTISTKKVAGGAYQIAYNFLMESLKHQGEAEWFYLVSEDVDEIIGDEFETLRGISYFVFPTQPDFNGSYRQVKNQLAEWEEKYRPDVIYTISSPCYFTFKTPEVMRFANAWVTNPNKYAWHSLSIKEWFRMILYRINQFRMLRKAKYIITQSEVVGKGLVSKLGLSEKNVKVVPNVLPKVFHTLSVEKDLDEKYVDIACVAAPFPHKNLGIVPKVLKVLKEKYGITNIRFHLTIPRDDATLNRIVKESKSYGLANNIVNHGRCPQIKLGEIYNRCSICFLPTLLETFSATTLEAMYFNVPIVATDFEFNREVIQDAGLYFQPTNADNAASQIVRLLSDKKIVNELKEKMRRRLSLYDNYENHFAEIMSFLFRVEKDSKLPS